MTLSVGLVIKVMTSSSTSFAGSGQALGSFCSQAGPFSHSLSSSCDTLTPLVPMSVGIIVLFTCRHSSTVDWSSISPTLLATKICCFLRAECSHWKTVVESVQCVTVSVLMSWSSANNYLSLTEYRAACSSNCGIDCCFPGPILHFPITNDNCTPSSSSARGCATVQIVSREPSEKLCKSIFL